MHGWEPRRRDECAMRARPRSAATAYRPQAGRMLRRSALRPAPKRPRRGRLRPVHAGAARRAPGGRRRRRTTRRLAARCRARAALAACCASSASPAGSSARRRATRPLCASLQHCTALRAALASRRDAPCGRVVVVHAMRVLRGRVRRSGVALRAPVRPLEGCAGSARSVLRSLPLRTDLLQAYGRLVRARGATRLRGLRPLRYRCRLRRRTRPRPGAGGAGCARAAAPQPRPRWRFRATRRARLRRAAAARRRGAGRCRRRALGRRAGALAAPYLRAARELESELAAPRVFHPHRGLSEVLFDSADAPVTRVAPFILVTSTHTDSQRPARSRRRPRGEFRGRHSLARPAAYAVDSPVSSCLSTSPHGMHIAPTYRRRWDRLLRLRRSHPASRPPAPA